MNSTSSYCNSGLFFKEGSRNQMVGISNFFVKCKKSALENSFWSDIKYKDLVQ